MKSRNTCLLLLFLFASALLQFSSAESCKGAEGDPYKPHPSPTKRIYTYDSPDPSKDTSPKSGSTIHFMSYNIQSGLSVFPSCNYVLNAQAVFLQGAHFFGLQEVDSGNILRCNCSQTEEMAKLTGKSTVFLNTIFYRLGLYGSAMGSAYPILDTRFSMYAVYSLEERGVTALRTQPPQLNGKFLWTLNTHFQYDSEEVRVGQALGLVAFIKSLVAEFPNDLVVLLGDFYVVPGLESYTILSNYLMNAWTVYNNGNPLGGPTYPANFPEHRFDHVWYRFPDGTVYNILLTNTEVQIIESTLSDHRPLKVDFDFSSSTPLPPSTAANAASLSTALATATTAGSTASGASTAAIGAATTASAAASATTAAATTSAAATTASATTSASATTAAASTSASATTASVTTVAAATSSAVTTSASATTASASTVAAVTSAAATTSAASTSNIATITAAATTAAATSDSSTTDDSTTADSSTTSDSSTTDVGGEPTDEPQATSFAVRQFNVSPVLLITLVAVFFIYL